MSKKSKKNSITISAVAVLGIIFIVAYQMLFGWTDTFKIVLGGMIFATFTVGVIQFLKSKLGNKIFKIR